NRAGQRLRRLAVAHRHPRAAVVQEACESQPLSSEAEDCYTPGSEIRDVHRSIVEGAALQIPDASSPREAISSMLSFSQTEVDARHAQRRRPPRTLAAIAFQGRNSESPCRTIAGTRCGRHRVLAQCYGCDPRKDATS